jgi:hypothetical protein
MWDDDRRFLTRSLDRLIGSFREAGRLIAKGQGSRIHGIEPVESELQCIEKAPDSPGAPYAILDNIAGYIGRAHDRQEKYNKLRDGHIIQAVREADTISTSVLAIGASHTRSGKPAPDAGCAYLEDVFEEELPDIRLLVVEPLEIERVFKNS